MINENCLFVHAPTIDSAWRESMWLCVRKGYDFLVKGGSYVGQIRKQLEHVTIVIDRPGTRPLEPILPPGLPAPTSEEKIISYFSRYLISHELAANEVYTYGQFIQGQLRRIVELLISSSGNTNQATICIGNERTTFLDDPPCLRSISFKVVDGRLNMTVYFRSWDLYAGLPENLSGLQLLKEYVLDMVTDGGVDAVDGKIIAFSDGLHLYEQYFPIIDQLNIDKIEVDERAALEKAGFLSAAGV